MVSSRGLSWRTGLDLALPAFLASRVTSRPAVEALLSSVVEADMGNLEMLLETYDARTTEALSSFPDDLALNFLGMVNVAAAAAIARWRKLTRAGEDMQDAHEEQDALLQEAFLADDGQPGTGRSGHVAGPLRRGLCSVVDVARGRDWDEVLRSQRRFVSCATWQIRIGRGCGRSKTGPNHVWLLTIALLLCRS